MKKFIFLTIVWILLTFKLFPYPENFNVVEPKFVCMTQDKIFNRELLPVKIDNQIYYGCCEMCANLIRGNPEKFIYAIDPISKKIIKKANAVILNWNGNAIYFENKKNLEIYLNKLKK